jgi:two-component system copper resistance phosphate regulon response regulator CusR
MHLFVTSQLLAERVRRGLSKDGITASAVRGGAQRTLGGRASADDVVLLDCLLGGSLNYASLLRRWRGESLAHLMVLLPHDSSSAARAACLDAGADVCLLEPLTVNELRAHLRALSRRVAAPSTQETPARRPFSPVRRVHDLEINLEARTVTRAGQLISLTSLEFDLLEFRAHRQGSIVSRTLLRAQLFKDRHGTRSNVVDVYIGYLRQKIDKGSATPLILTCWGRGYLLRAANG